MIVGCLLVHQSERYVVHGYVPLAVEVRGHVLELVLTHLQEGDAASAMNTIKVHRYIVLHPSDLLSARWGGGRWGDTSLLLSRINDVPH